jgi:cytochrome c7-like protein
MMVVIQLGWMGAVAQIKSNYLMFLVVGIVLALLLAPVLHRLVRRRQPSSKQSGVGRNGEPSLLVSFLNNSILTAVLVGSLFFSLFILIPKTTAFRLPGDQIGYQPPQPIAFSHQLHAGELQVSCLYCHFGTEKSRHAGVPPENVCMNCHKFVTAPLGAVRAEDEQAKKEGRPPRRIVSPELAKLYDALALGPKMQPDSARQPHPIAWTKVHNLPDFVYFDHRAHVHAGVTCQTCHGPVETMERVRQEQPLTMGWCVHCHRDVNQKGVDGKRVNASTDCSTCHY